MELLLAAAAAVEMPRRAADEGLKIRTRQPGGW
jgi:hypothetical protein